MVCIVGQVVLNAYLFSLYLIAKLLPVCPTYALLQSGHVNLYALECAYLSGGWCWGISSFGIVLVVHQAIFRSVFLNRLVMNVVSLPVYVNDAHLCVVVLVSLTNVVVGHLRVGGLCVWTGNPLLDRMSWMVSSLYLSSFKWYVFSLLYRNLTSAYLCLAGWFEVYGMIMSVNVGFLCLEITQLVGFVQPQEEILMSTL